jgi:O-methyltransferase
MRLAADVERRGVPGSLVDCGVWNGGSTVLLALGAPNREAWAFDSFAGLPAPGPRDGGDSQAHTGACVGSADSVRAAFARFAPNASVHVRAGWFKDTFPDAADQIGQVAVLHVDGDWYESVRLTLEVFYPKVPAGGYIVVDDYGTWPGARSATDEFRRQVGDDARLVKIDHTGRYWKRPHAA